MTLSMCKFLSKVSSFTRLGMLMFLVCGTTLLSTPNALAQKDSHRDRMNRIDDHFSSRLRDRQGRGQRGRNHNPDNPVLDRFQTIDGSYNNRKRPVWGVATANLWRRAPSAYADGISEPARMDQPSAREISNLIFDQTESIPNNRGLTDMVWQWGQFLDHDIDLTETHFPLEPFPILVPEGDELFDPDSTGNQMILLFRSIYNTGSGISTPREQLNLITSWIDASNIYGSDEETLNNLRLFQRGMLRISSNPTGHMLPVDADGFFLSGDVRVNEQVGLISMHTLFMREHNRMCRRILAGNPNLTDEQVFWNARKQVIAIIQSITYNEFLPAILGPDALRPYRGYNDRIFPNIANCFSTSAYRFGHSMLNSQILRLDDDGNEIAEGHLSLADAFFSPDKVQELGIDPYLRGLYSQQAQEIDSQVIGDVRNFLFGQPGAGGFDLVSLNIQRGRDHGLPSLNEIRATYRLPTLLGFSDLTSDPVVQLQLEVLYEDIDNVDPWVGMLCEDHVPGASVGWTAFAVIKDQFQRLRDGDRFWYETQFSGAALNRIRGTRLSNVIRRNTNISKIPLNVFQVPGFDN